jgi:hypothetical protein
MDARDAAAAWARQWLDGWKAHDPDSIVAMYAPENVHRSTPFRPPHAGPAALEDYLREAFAEERELVDVRFSEPLVDGDRAAVEYWAVYVDAATGLPTTLAGSCFLRFGPDGRVVRSRDYWHREDGEYRPHPEWGG